MEIYRNLEGPYTKNDFEVKVKLPHPIVSEFITYRHCNLPLMGVGPNGPSNLFMYFDKFFDTSVLKKIKDEVSASEEKKIVSFNKIVANGIVPTEFNNQKSIDSYIDNITKYAKDDSWKETIQKFTRKGDIKVFLHDYFNLKVAWEGIAMFRKYDGTYENKSKPSEWLGLIEHLPTMQKFIDSLPFKYIGYVMIFKSSGHNPVLVHRDYYPTNHNVNFINFRLDQKPRPFYLMDAYSKEKKYIDPKYDCYFFNEIDPHGLDTEDGPRLTMRVEGQFTDEFSKAIGLNSADTFNWNYEHCQKFLNSGHFRIESSTDI